MKKAILVAMCTALMISCASVPKDFTDPRDGKTYKAVKIGEQIWLAENLNYYAKGSKCYDDNPDNCTKYGRLYNWNTAMKACPDGWHLSSDKEWQTLMDFAGGDYVAGKKLKAKNGWNDDNGTSGNGTDDYSFSALPGGYGLHKDKFISAGDLGRWWSVGEHENSGYAADQDNYDKSFLQSVRCLKD